MKLPFAREVAIDEVGDSCVGEEEEGSGMLIVQEEIGGCWSGDKARRGEKVRDVVDVLVRGTSAAGESRADG